MGHNLGVRYCVTERGAGFGEVMVLGDVSEQVIGETECESFQGRVLARLKLAN